MKNEYYVNRKMYVIWALENMLQRKRVIAVVIALVICGALVAFGLSGGGQPLLIFFAVFFFYWAILRNLHMASKTFSQLSKRYGVKKWTRAVEFTPEEILITEGDVSISMPYSKVEDVWEKRNRILLVFEGSTVVRLYRDAFTEGTWEDCRQLLEEGRNKTPAVPEEAVEEE